MKPRELREMTNEELERRLRERNEDLLSFRVQLTVGTVDNVRAARTARRDIARIKTVLRERELAATRGTK